MNTFAATTLIIEISCRAARLPAVSIFHAACMTISRAPSISIRERAMKSCTNCFSPRGPPNALRSSAAFAHHLERPLRAADRAHAVVDASRTEPVLGDHEPLPALAEEVRLRHPAALVAHLPVARAAVMTHHGDRANSVEARGIGWHQDHARPLVWRRVGLRHDHRDGHRGAVRAGRVPLVTVDHPLVAVEHRGRLEPGGVGAGGAGLGHREAAAGLALEQRPEPAVALLLRPVLREDLHVAGVGRRAVEHHRRDQAPAHVLAEEPVVEVRQARPVLRVRHEEVPQAVRARTRAQLDQDRGVRNARPDLIVEGGERLGLHRLDVLADEGANAFAERLDLGRGGEVHAPQANRRKRRRERPHRVADRTPPTASRVPCSANEPASGGR